MNGYKTDSEKLRTAFVEMVYRFLGSKEYTLCIR